MNSRIIALIDMDCFYCQVECKINPSLHGKPLAVVQYNTWKGGGIIAVNYEARHKGVTRHMRGDEAKQHCPEIELCRVPSVRGKADISKYRNAGREVIAVLSEFSSVVERASIDEAYIDLTDVVHERMKSMDCIVGHQLSNTFIVGYGPENNDEDARKAGVSEWLTQVYQDGDSSVMESTEDFLQLAVAGVIVEEIRAAVLSKTQFHCSAGIAHNKVLAKLVCGLHKPQKQSILPHCSVSSLYASLPVKKVRHLGGKLGDEVVERLQCSTMIELEKFSLKQLQTHFDEKTASWLYYIARGMDNEPVNARLVSKSIGCCKRFPGKTCLATRTDVAHWIQELADEVCERLEDDLTLNKRRAQLLTVSFTQEVDCKVNSCSRSTPISSYKIQDIVETSMQVINKTNSAPVGVDVWSPPLLFLGLSASKFSTLGSNQSIQQFFKPQNHPESIRADPSSTEEQKHESEHNSRKPEHVLTHFNKVSPFQLELSKLEKKLVEKFKNFINLKLHSCSSKNVDKVVLLDIVTEIKSNATANVKKLLRNYLKSCDNSNDSSVVDIYRIEQKVVELVEMDIEQSLKDINEILFDDRGERVGKNNDSVENERISSFSITPDQMNTDTSDDNISLNAVKTTESSSNFAPNTLNSVVCPEQNSRSEQNFTESTEEKINKNDSDVITYTRRQVHPENISDSHSDDSCKLKNSSLQIITRSMGSIPITKYETVEKNYSNVPCNITNLFINTTKISPLKKNPKANPSNDSQRKEKSYSFFENYLRRKKERESLSLSSVKSKQNLIHEQSAEPMKNDNIQDVDTSNDGEKNMSTDMNDELLQDTHSNNTIDHNDDYTSNNLVPTDSDHLEKLELNKIIEYKKNLEIAKETDRLIYSIDVDSLRKSNYPSNIIEHNVKNRSNGNTFLNTMSTSGHVFPCSETNESIAPEPTKIRCEKCNLDIDVNEIQEHQDYHFALELSTTVQTQSALPSTSSSSKILNKKSGKRGRPSKLNSFKNSENFKKLKTIDQFFKPSSLS